MKTCADCKQVRPIDQFNRSIGYKDGHMHICRNCQKLRKAAWDSENREHARDYKSRWTKANRELVRQRDKSWKSRNPDKVKATNQSVIRECSPAYVASMLHVPVEILRLHPALLEAKRLQTIARRAYLETKEILKSKSK
jgi:hypothetical protein